MESGNSALVQVRLEPVLILARTVTDVVSSAEITPRTTFGQSLFRLPLQYDREYADSIHMRLQHGALTNQGDRRRSDGA
jgi:hypothetical protein